MTSTEVLDPIEEEYAGPREKGRFPLLVPGMVFARGNRRAVSGHGVGMLITWLHRSAIAARNEMAEKAKNYFQKAVDGTQFQLKKLRDDLEKQGQLWSQLVKAIDNL